MLMTPGPTEVPHRVRNAMAKGIQNPDIDPEFASFYSELEEKLKKIYRTQDDVLVLAGEGILGLEASIASLMDKGDKVICISNGIFGDGFADLVKMYGGEPTLCKVPYNEEIDVDMVETALEDNDHKIVTMVHCETPTGVINDLEPILQRSKEQGVITVVDAVSSLGGCSVPVDMMDVCIGGSQKCFSSPPGLTTVSLSPDAWDRIMERDASTLYTSFKIWREMWYENGEFPYTHMVSNLYGLDASLDLILEEGLEDVFHRHRVCSELCIELGQDMGLELYPEDKKISSPTVTAFKLDGRAVEVQRDLARKHDIWVATSLGQLKNDVLRVGHMGHNARRDKVEKTMAGIEDVL